MWTEQIYTNAIKRQRNGFSGQQQYSRGSSERPFLSEFNIQMSVKITNHPGYGSHRQYLTLWGLFLIQGSGLRVQAPPQHMHVLILKGVSLLI